MSSSIDSSEKSKSQDGSSPILRVLELLQTFYGAVGNAPTVEGAVALMAKTLSDRATIEQINAALNECSTVEYPVRLPHILAKLPGQKGDIENEARLAWDIVEKFSSKWLRWNEDRTRASIEKNAPDLAPRIVDSVRRSGGWSAYLRMTDEDFPFVQKRFFEEYKAWSNVEAITDRARLLEIPQVKQLAAAAPKMPELPSRSQPSKPEPRSANVQRVLDHIRRRTS